MQLKSIDQQVVVIVGASSGIGRSAALAFAKRGAKVAVAARNQKGLDSLVEEIVRSGGEAIAIPADVADFDRVREIAQQTVEVFGGIDTWVHNAAVGMVAPFDDVTIEEFRRVIDVTLMGQVYGAKVAIPYLKRSGQGSFISISSMEGRRALPLQSAYSTAKHGVEGFIESLRVELDHANANINVASIRPAVINTPFYNHARTKLGVKPTGIPPYYDPRLVSDAILYVAEHPTRDYIVGDVGRLLDLTQRLSPKLVDQVLAVIGFRGQRTDDTKASQAPDNLFGPMSGYEQVDGDFDEWVVPSVSDWLQQHPLFSGTMAAAAAAALLATANIRKH